MDGSASREGPVAPPPVPADVAMVVAMGMEIQPFVAGLENVRRYSNERQTVIEGECAGKLVRWLWGGWGGAWRSGRRGYCWRVISRGGWCRRGLGGA